MPAFPMAVLAHFLISSLFSSFANALRGSAFLQSEASLQVVTAAKDNGVRWHKAEPDSNSKRSWR